MSEPHHFVIVGIVIGALVSLWMIIPRRPRLPNRRLDHEALTVPPPMMAPRAVPGRLDDEHSDIAIRMDLQLSALDELIIEADREIARLESLLSRQQPTQRPAPPLSAADQQRCFDLWEAGYSIAETAERLSTSAEAVQRALDEWRLPLRRAA